jgi:hypothetical protein
VNWDSNSKRNWNTNAPVSDWFGITVETISGQEHVVKIDLLGRNDLNGTLPKEIGNFSELKHLQIIFHESLTGDIPVEIGNLTKLEFLSLWDNNLTGKIPSEIGNCINLIDFSLEDNQLTGNIPLSFKNLNKLRAFWVNGNQLSGTIPEIFSSWDELLFFSIGAKKTDGLFNNFDGNIDLSNNTNLSLCWIYNNNISTLNIKNGNNTSISNKKFNSENNPNLNCIIVDDKTFSSNTWLNVEVNAPFKESTQECSTLNVNDHTLKKSIAIFPNPTDGIINISNNIETEIKYIKVENLKGQILKKMKFKKIIDITKFNSGIYFISFEYKNGNNSKSYKVIRK